MSAQDQALIAAFMSSKTVKVCPTRVSLGSKQLRKGRSRRFIEE